MTGQGQEITNRHLMGHDAWQDLIREARTYRTIEAQVAGTTAQRAYVDELRNRMLHAAYYHREVAEDIRRFLVDLILDLEALADSAFPETFQGPPIRGSVKPDVHGVASLKNLTEESK